TNAWLVIVGETRRIDHRFAAKSRCFAIDKRRIVFAKCFEALRTVFWQISSPVETRHLFDESSHDLIGPVRSPVGEWRKETRDLAIAVGLGKFAVHRVRLALFCLNRAITQHQMREIE